MDVLQAALSGTEERGNASREFHVSITVLGLSEPLRGELVEVTDNMVKLEEYELSRNGQWLAVEAAPRFLVREIISSAQIIYLDGGK